MTTAPACFKAYDIRGRVPDDLDETLAYRIGRAYASWLDGDDVVVGRDVRRSSPDIARAVVAGLLEGGMNVHDIGLCGTEEVNFATAHWEMDGGIVITASHNPADHNGMKLVAAGARPIARESGLAEIGRIAADGSWRASTRLGTKQELDHRPAYIARLLQLVDVAALPPLRVVVNPGNGCAGPVVDALEAHLPFELVRIQHSPDGDFPNGVPNPLLPERREATALAVRKSHADLGVAWDGDFDRCFFFDGEGRFVEGYYVIGLLAEAALRKAPGSRVIHDPRLTWNTVEVCHELGGSPVQSRTGHAYLKERMRREDAAYGGEMSGHHYFRDFAYCDSGMIPWLLVAELMGRSGKSLAQLVNEAVRRFPVSGEINRHVADPDAALAALESAYAPDARSVDYTDGLSVEYADWRFNVRMSNTEPLIRLNVEARGDRELMERRTDELLRRLDTLAVAV